MATPNPEPLVVAEPEAWFGPPVTEAFVVLPPNVLIVVRPSPEP